MKKSHTKLPEHGLRPALKAKSKARREEVSAIAAASIVRLTRNDLLPEIKSVDLSPQQLLPPARQVRKIEPAHLQEVISSIQNFGFCVPPLIDSGQRILDGVIRIEAAKRLGLASIRCLQVGHLSKDELRMLRLALNRLGEKGQWDLAELRIELSELIAAGISIEASGFVATEIDQILIDDDLVTPPDGPLSPDPNQKPAAKLGDIFVLGKHRIICGDATKPETYSRLMKGQAARLILTDPPYNVPVEGNVTKRPHREFLMASGEMSEAEFASFNTAWFSAALPHLIEGGLVASFIDWRGYSSIYEAARKQQLQQLNLVVWCKTNAGMGSLYRSQHELVPIFKKGSATHINNVQLGKHGRWRSNVWDYPGASSLNSDSRQGLQFHPTVKPVAMLEDAILDITKRGEIILDPFLGSGSTLIAAERHNRVCYGVELDPSYIDVAVKRFKKAFDVEATLIDPSS